MTTGRNPERAAPWCSRKALCFRLIAKRLPRRRRRLNEMVRKCGKQTGIEAIRGAIMTKDDEKLTALFVSATKGQDKAAMDEFLAIVVPKLTGYVGRWCNKRGRSWDFAEAVACGSLMKALGAAASFDSEKCGGKVMGWLVVIARREFIECIRFMERGDCESLDEKLKRPVQGKDAREEDKRDALRIVADSDPVSEVIRREAKERLNKVLPALTSEKRQVVELYREGMRVGAIAITLDLLPERVSKILFDAKAELRRRFG
jgi:RNA polymerase sigma factor (sigma-70 family)